MWKSNDKLIDSIFNDLYKTSPVWFYTERTELPKGELQTEYIKNDEQHSFIVTLPGFEKSDIKVSTKKSKPKNLLIIELNNLDKNPYYKLDKSTHKYKLPDDVDPDNLDVKYKSGVLDIGFNPQESTEPETKTFEIE